MMNRAKSVSGLLIAAAPALFVVAASAGNTPQTRVGYVQRADGRRLRGRDGAIRWGQTHVDVIRA
jgi:hypothetical protein